MTGNSEQGKLKNKNVILSIAKDPVFCGIAPFNHGILHFVQDDSVIFTLYKRYSSLKNKIVILSIAKDPVFCGIAPFNHGILHFVQDDSVIFTFFKENGLPRSGPRSSNISTASVRIKKTAERCSAVILAIKTDL